jgi:predicted metal-dependent hydrolase
MTKTFKDIEYTVIRHKRKTASIHIERDGHVSIIVPEKLTDQEVEDLLEAKRKWIYKNLAEWRELNAARVTREYVNGEGFLYLGRSYRLQRVSDQPEPLMLKDGYFCLRATKGSPVDADTAFKEFYRQKGSIRIPPRVDYYKSKLGVEPKSIKVMDLKNRWASWTPGGHLNFHWKCMMAPLSILDYFVVHELVHLIHPNHSVAFWNEVDKILPDYRERITWLRTHGSGFDL